MFRRWQMGVAVLLCLTACASLIKESCNRDGAYEKGMNDARSGAAMNSQYAALCEEKVQSDVRAAYRQGYETGLAAEAATTPQPLVQINENPPMRWYCELSPFMKAYGAFGASLEEAEQNVIDRCLQSEDAMFCKDPKCRHTR